MTRPRSQQINDPSTRYTRYSLPTNPVPGLLSTVISGAAYTSLVNSTATQTPGGSEVATSAILTGNILDPFVVAAGFTFNVSYDGNAPVAVVLLAGEDTGYEIANRINTTLGTTIASRTNDGYLRLTSPTAGSNSLVSISGSPGNLSTLGFGAVASATAFGTDPTRGIVTNGPDNLGGYLFVNGSDNSPVVATSDTLFSSDLLPGEALLGNTSSYTQKIPTGQPIFGRLTHNSSTPSFTINWYAKCDGSEPIRSYLSDFPSINPGQTLDLSYLDPFTASSNSFSAIFAGTEVTSADVAFRINNAWNGSTGGLFGKVVSTLNGPYFPSGNLVFSLNGSGPLTVIFPGDKKYASDIVSDINSAIGALQGLASVVGSSFNIASTAPLLVGGETSVVEILPSSTPNVLRALGLSVGKYAGWQICRAVGAEIEISMPSPYTIYTILASSTALTALGLGAYPVSPNSLPTVTREIPVGFPSVPTSITGLSFNSQPTSSAYNILIPEYMEAGDIQDNNFTQNKISDNVTSNTSAYSSSLTGGGALNFGSQARYGRDGNIQPLSMPFFVPLMKLGGITFNNQALDPLTYTSFRSGSGTTTFEALSSLQPSLRTIIIPNSALYSNPSYTITSNLTNVGADNFNADDPAFPGSILNLSTDSFSISLRDSGVADPYIPENDVTLQPSSILTTTDRDFVFNKDTVLNFAGAPGKISDTLINAPGGPIVGYIPLSDANSPALKAHDQVLQNSSLLQHVNARIEITVGDGTNTFGDFNGATALDDVVNLLASDLTIRPVVIKCKSGTYTPANTLSFSRDVTIIGDGNDVNILAPIGGNTLEFSGVGKEIYLENISVSCDTGAFSIFSSCPISATRCEFVCLQLTSAAAGGLYADFNNCTINSIPSSIGLEIIHGSGTPSLSFRGCTFNSSTLDARCVRVVGKIGNSPFQQIKFEDCTFSLGPCTVTPAGGGYTFPYSNVNTGLIELNPLNDGRTSPGLVIDRLIYKNCTVSAIGAGGANVIIQLTSSLTNQLESAYASPGTYGSVTNLEFSGCKFTWRLSPNPSISLSGFSIGYGIANLIIDECDFYGDLPSSTTGKLGIIPEWSRFLNTTINGQKEILIGCENSIFTNNRIYNITPGLSNSAVNAVYAYFVYNNSSVLNNRFLPDISKQGNGSDANLASLIKLDSSPSTIYHNTEYNVCQFNRNTLVGESTVLSWFIIAISCSGTNTSVNNNVVKNWISPTPVATGVYTDQYCGNTSVYDNKIRDTTDGIYIDRTKKIIVTGNDLVVNDSGIIYQNDNSNMAESIIISNNYVRVIASTSTLAAIDLIIHEYDGEGLNPSDTVSPALRLTNNYVNFGNYSSTIKAFSLKPGAPSISGDRAPKGVIIGNVSRIAHDSPVPLSNFGDFYIYRWDSGTSSYLSINGQDIPRYKLIGAHTDNNKTEYFGSTATTVTAGNTLINSDPIVISGLGGPISLSLVFDITFACSSINAENIFFELQYSTTGGVSWVTIPNSSRLISTQNEATYSSTISIAAVIDINSTNIVLVTSRCNIAGVVPGVGKQISWAQIVTAKTPKPVYQANADMLMNSCLLKP